MLAAVAPAAAQREARPAQTTGAQALADALIANNAAMRTAIAGWRATGDPPTAPPPPELLTSARYLQLTARRLASQPGAAAATIALLPPLQAFELRQFTAASRSLRKLAGAPHRALPTGEPEPLASLLGHYRGAGARHGLEWRYLAGINLVETVFGRIKSDSVAGAKGPMQFIPSTWRIHGRGGDIHDPRDAIHAAARLLRSGGAPRSYASALHAYNPSRLYVDAVSRYVRVIRRDAEAIYFLYCWGG